MIAAVKKAIVFTFYCFLAVPSFAQTAAILPQGVTQYFDNNGNPLTSGKVYNYVVGTLTFKTTWQDAGETIANTNPVTLDAAGRAKILGQGAYRQIVRKSNGDLVWDAVTTSTGGGSGGGGSSTGDGDLVGTIKPWAGLAAPNQYAFAYGQELSRTTYSSLLTAITQTITNILCTSASATLTGFSDTSQINIGAPVEISCMAAGTIVLSKTSSTVTVNHNATGSTTATGVFFPFGNGDGSTTFNIPDLRGYIVAGRDNMGGIAASRLTTAYFGSNDPAAQGATGGLQSTTISSTNLPAYKPDITVHDPSHFHSFGTAAKGAAGTLQVADGSQAANSTTLSAATGISVELASNLGSSTPFTIIQPTITLNYIIKVTPDTSSASASGVTAIEGMTGNIACGSGLSCTGNIIGLTTGSLTAPSIASGFCTSPSISATAGPAAFAINIGTGCAGGTGTLTMPASTTGWVCNFYNVTSPDTSVVNMISGNTITSVAVKNYVRTTGVGGNFADSNVIRASCTAY